PRIVDRDLAIMQIACFRLLQPRNRALDHCHHWPVVAAEPVGGNARPYPRFRFNPLQFELVPSLCRELAQPEAHGSAITIPKRMNAVELGNVVRGFADESIKT